jgi:glycosyltransferase 2 family protein
MRKYARILGSVILLAVIAWRLEWDHVAAAFRRLDVRYFVGAVLLYVFLQVASSLRWRLLARVQGFDGAFCRYVAYYFIGMFFNLALPTSVGGDVVRIWYLAGHERSGPASGRRLAALVSVLAERVNGVVVLVTLACVSALLCPIPLDTCIVWIVTGVGVVTLLGLLSIPGLHALFAAFPRLATSTQLAPVHRLVDSGWRYRHSHGVLVAATVLSAVVQIGNVVIGYFLGQALGLRVPALYYGLIVPLVALLALMPISLNGMGLRETGFVVLLMPLGVSETEAVTFGFLTFAVTAVASLSGIGFYLWGRYPRFRPAAGDAARREHEPTLAA